MLYICVLSEYDIYMCVVLHLCMYCLCVLFKMPACYWHSRDSHNTCYVHTHMCKSLRPLLPPPTESWAASLPSPHSRQLFNTKYLFSAKTLFLYEFSLTSFLSPNQPSLISALFIQKQVATHACLIPEPPCSILASQRPHQVLGHQDQPDVSPAYQCRCLAAGQVM